MRTLSALSAGMFVTLLATTSLAQPAPTAPPAPSAPPGAPEPEVPGPAPTPEAPPAPPPTSPPLAPAVPGDPAAPTAPPSAGPAPLAPFSPPPLLFIPPRPVFEDEPAPKVDWLGPVAGTTLGVGLAFVLGGAITLGTGGGGEYCGIGGCVDRPDRRSENLGASLVGAGIGLAVPGGLGLAGWAAAAPRGAERRKSPPLMVTGFALTSLAGAGLGVGFAQAATYAPDGDLSTAWPWLMASSISAGIGVPMLAIGSKVLTPAQREEAHLRALRLSDSRAPKRLYSGAMVGVGSALTSIGGTGILAATGLFFADVAEGGPDEVSASIALPALGVGTFLTAVGVPLIVVGAHRDVAADAAAPPVMPQVSTSGTGLRAEWRLP